MIITTDIAQSIVNEMINVIDYNVNIMNHEGVIVASGDPDRINQIHQGALEAIELKRERIIHRPDNQIMLGTNVGVNVPIEINKEIVGVVGITGDPTKIYKLIHVIKITVETLLEQQLLIEQLRYKQTALEEWVQNLADSTYSDISILESKANYLNIDLSLKCTFIAIEIKDFNKTVFDYKILHQNEVKIIKAIKLYFPQALFPTYLGKGLFIIGYPMKTNKNNKQYTNTCRDFQIQLKKEGYDSYVGIGCLNKGIMGYRASLLEALQSIDILKQIKSEKKIAHITEWGILQLFAQIPANLRRTYLSQFTNRKPVLTKELEETLIYYLNNELNIKQTSKEMHIHRNTLIYRLDKIKSLWGLDPRKFSDAVKLQLIYWCKQLN